MPVKSNLPKILSQIGIEFAFHKDQEGRRTCVGPVVIVPGKLNVIDMSETAADVPIDTIQDWGVEIIFGLPGSKIAWTVLSDKVQETI